MSTYDAGKIEARLILDRSEFNHELDQARADADKFSGKGITAKVKADTATADKAITATQARADKLGKSSPTVKVAVDDAQATARIAQTEARIQRLNNIVARPKVSPEAQKAYTELDKLNTLLDELGKKAPSPKVDADTAAAKARVDELNAKLDRLETRDTEVRVRASADLLKAKADLEKIQHDLDRINSSPSTSGLDRLQKAADKLKGGGGPTWLGPLLLALPALTTLTGAAGAAGIGMAGAFTAGGGALAAFGAVAKPVLSDALKAQAAVNTAQNKYTIAIAHGTKPAAAYKAEQIAIAKAYADMSPAQIALSKQLGNMAQAWQTLKQAQTPVVAGALQPWLRSVTDLTKNLAPIIAQVAPVIKDLGTQFDALVNSSAFRGFRDFIASTGSQAVGAIGGTLIDFVKSFMVLLPKFNPLIQETVGWIGGLGPAMLRWANSKKAADDITKFMDWFNRNGPVVGGLLKNIGAALKTLVPGLAAGGAEELKVLSGFFGFIAKLPPGLAGPLAETAGALLLLNKLGVFSVGVKFVGLASGWVKKLLGGAAVDIGAAGMQRAGNTMVAAAEAMQRAANTMLGGGGGIGAAGGAGVAEAAGTAGAAGLGDVALGSGVAGAATGTGIVGGALPAAALILATSAAQYFQNKMDPVRPVTPQQENTWSPAKQAAQMHGGQYTAPGGLPSSLPKVAGLPGSGRGGALTGTEYGAVFASKYSKADLEWLMKTYGITLPQAIKVAGAAQLDLGRNFAAAGKDQSNAIAETGQWLNQLGNSAPAFDKAIKSQALYATAMRQFSALMAAHHPIAQAFTGDLVTSTVKGDAAARMVQAYAADVLGYGRNADQTKGAREALIRDFESQGLSAQAANKLVDLYTAQIGANGKTTGDYRAIRAQLIRDFESQGLSAGQATALATGYTVAIVKNQLQTAAGHVTRQQIITDLENAGLNARQATTYANNYTTSLKKIPKDERTTLELSGSGTWSVTQAQQALNSGKSLPKVTQGVPVGVAAKALGGVLPGYSPGVDNMLIAVSGGEGILVPEAVRGMGGAPAIDAINRTYAGHRGAGRGFATGGVVASGRGVPSVGDWAYNNVQATNGQMIATMKAQMTAYVAAQKAAAAKAAAAAGSGGASYPGGGSVGPGAAAAQSWMKAHLGDWGWGQDQFPPLVALWNHESGWRYNAQNPTSPAYGIPQADPGSKMAAAGSDWRTNPVTQMRWGAGYIKGSYGNPAHAWAFEMSHTPNWYAGGSDGAAAGWAVTGEQGPELVKMRGGETVLPAHVTSAILGGSQKFPGYAAGAIPAAMRPKGSSGGSGVLAGLISGAPREGWAKDVANLKHDLAIIATTLGIKGLSRKDTAHLKGEQGADENELMVATAYLQKLQAAKKRIMSVTEPQLQRQISALAGLGKIGKLSAAESRLLKTLKASLAAQQAKLGRIDTAIYGKAAAKPKAAAGSGSAAASSGDTGSADSGAAGGGSPSASTAPPKGQFVGVLPGPPGSGPPDITGGGTGGLGGNGSTILGITGFPAAAGYSITPQTGSGAGGAQQGWGGFGGAGGGGQNIESLLTQILSATRAAPAATGGHLGQALNGVSRSAYAQAMSTSGPASPW